MSERNLPGSPDLPDSPDRPRSQDRPDASNAQHAQDRPDASDASDSPDARDHRPAPASPRRLDRRALLQAAGVGAGVFAAGAITAGRVAMATGTHGAKANAAASADLPLTGGRDFPIGLYWPPHPFETTLSRYREITDAGFTFLLTGNYQLDEASANQALGMADQVGLKVLVAGDPRVAAIAQHMTVTDDRKVPSSITTADAAAWVRSSVAGYTRHPSFAGFSLYDEPGSARFPNLGALTEIVRETAPALLPYVNLNRGNGARYAKFLRAYLDTVQPSLLSFDRYPILTDRIDTDYFDTWAIVRAEALKAGVPAWTYIQSTGFNGHATPTASQLAWQVNVSLAYGCKGIQYFTYWTPDPARGEGYTEALITTDGRQTPLYAAARTLNRTWLQPVGRQLKPLVSESVQHANDTPLPTGTTPFTPGRHLTTATGDPAVLALFKGAPDNGTRHLLVTNRDPDRPATLRIGLNRATVKAVSRFEPADGTYPRADPPTTLTVELAAGAAALYRLTPN
ncbi:MULTISPECIES: hypothetical protein [unclassified Streptomyces]|uniref:hypothetical protein n=1 Tax=unclassified Streptomyces TaxID=2593676 RepID=UPI002E2DDA30|nr:hypothetical protein [Streptomyces sp. NBC_00223]